LADLHVDDVKRVAVITEQQILHRVLRGNPRNPQRIEARARAVGVNLVLYPV